ncbi:MAG: ATP-binding protein [Pseudomonadota bacterium]
MHPRSLNFALSSVFLLFFLLIAALGLFSIERLREFNEVSADVRDIWLPSTRVIGDLNNLTSDFRAAEGRYLLSANQDSSSNRQEIDGLREAVAQAQTGYEAIRLSPASLAIYARFKTSWATYLGVADRVLQLHAAGRTSEAVDLYRTSSQAAYDKVSEALDRVTQINVASAAAASDQVGAAYRHARTLVIVAMAIAAVLVAAALLYVKRFVSIPLRDLAGGMRRLARNDTDIEIRGIERIDEIGGMARALAVFRTNAIELMLSQRSLSQQASMLEERLAEEQRLNQLQQDFVSMASHEFRTPLTVIDGHAQRLAKMGGHPDVLERAGKIRRSVLRMTAVIDTLLSSSRLIEGGAQLYFHPVEIDLRTVLEEVCQLHREIAPQSRISQNFGSRPLSVAGDSKLLFQMFANLISNALKYSPDDSFIDVTARLEGAAIVIDIRDRGVGIPKKDLATIFGRYNRGSNVSGIVGTGVGLYLVRIVAELHGGSVTVESVEDKGSCFTIRLPASGEPEHQSPARQASIHAGQA